MITDTEIKTKGLQLLAKHLGNVEAERFVALIQREPFDYTKLQSDDLEINNPAADPTFTEIHELGHAFYLGHVCEL
jgi:hypothetical protein